MVNQEHLDILKQGAETWNKWRIEHPEIQPQLIGVDAEEVLLRQTDLRGVNLSQVNLEGADLSQINLENADISEANLKGANLTYVNLKGANLYKTCLKEAILQEAELEGANLNEANFQAADLRRAKLERAHLQRVRLEMADLRWTNLDGADLKWASLEGTDLYMAQLRETDLKYAAFNINTNLKNVFLGDKKLSVTSLLDVHWSDVDLTVVDWMQLMRKANYILEVSSNREINEYRLEVRACRQIALALQSQGLNYEADQFAYRAQIIQRTILKRQIFLQQGGLLPDEQQIGLGHGIMIRKFGAYVFSLFLDLLAGYGYRPSRSFYWYIGANAFFTLVYFFLSPLNGFHLTCIHLIHSFQQICTQRFVWSEGLGELGESFAASFTAFHGRGFFPDQFGRGDPRTYFAALEAAIGLFIEASFIATFTSRFYRK